LPSSFVLKDFAMRLSAPVPGDMTRAPAIL
jgi:hypothetical protein